MPLILHDFWRSSASYRVRIALALKGVAYERHPVSLTSGEQRDAGFLAINPHGLVPTLVLEDGTALTQSVAIIEWLDATYPMPRLIPVEPLARARCMARVLAIAADIHPLNNLRVLRRLTGQFGADEAAREDWCRHWVEIGLEGLEAEARPLPGPLLGGAQPDVSDVMLVPQMYNARRLGVDLAPYPRLVSADAAACALPPFAAAHPDNFKPD